MLIAYGADLHKKDAQGPTPLDYARAYNRDVVELLLEKGADVDATGALHWAVYVNEEEIVELFLAHGADVNARDRAGETPLDEAIRLDHKVIIELLKQHGGVRGVPAGKR